MILLKKKRTGRRRGIPPAIGQGLDRGLLDLDALLVEKRTDGVAGLGAPGEPELGLRLVDSYLLVLGFDGVVEADLVDGLAVAGRAVVHDDDAVVGTGFGAEFLEPYFDAHGFLLNSKGNLDPIVDSHTPGFRIRIGELRLSFIPEEPR
ncbi:hypothetical protein SDC9_16652 [bioreactor metagenome]|uniref:Uncharacterized protein n=1 Tax=bioreactor metagenome TaxID=1076179 RepID=A0A644TVF9_9ZZZZ|nr:hypothetical protein TRIP_E280222 [uncultured Spirochaetota bacterium]